MVTLTSTSSDRKSSAFSQLAQGYVGYSTTSAASALIRDRPALLPLGTMNETPQVKYRLQRAEDPHRPRRPQARAIDGRDPAHRIVRRPAQPPVVRQSEIREEALLVHGTELQPPRAPHEVVGPRHRRAGAGALLSLLSRGSGGGHVCAPDVHAHVLAAAGDERAVARDRSGEHAARHVQGQRAQLAAVRVEDPQAAVVRSRDDPVPVGGERDRVDGRRVAVRDGEEGVAGGEVPDPDRFVFGAGEYLFVRVGDADG